MSIGGIIVIKTIINILLDVQNKSTQEQTYMNADFILSNVYLNEIGNNTSFKDIKGFNDNQIDKIKI